MIRRRTKIVATLGPATDAPEVLLNMIAAGVDVVRLNFSHGRPEQHSRRAQAVRDAAAQLSRDVAILCDLQGPKIRIGAFQDDAVQLREGDSFAIDTALADEAGDANCIGCSYTALPGDVRPEDHLLLDDGNIVLRVEHVHDTRVHTRVVVGGRLSSRKGINKQGGGLSAAALTDKDREDVRHAVALDADFIAVSFPRSAQDLREARSLVTAAGGRAGIIAKIERCEALNELGAIVAASDAVMVARGDLGVEIGDAELPGWQKRILAEAQEQNRMAITATQMMESMIHHPAPTRAEVLDVANAVLDGTDAVMLSAETAAGKFPVKVIEAVARVCLGAERGQRQSEPKPRLKRAGHFAHADEAVAIATASTADQMQADAIIALTESGATPLMVSRSTNHIPIYALTRHRRTRNRMALCRGVYPVEFLDAHHDGLHPAPAAIAYLTWIGWIQSGSRILVTHGDGSESGGTNTMKVLVAP